MVCILRPIAGEVRWVGAATVCPSRLAESLVALDHSCVDSITHRGHEIILKKNMDARAAH